MTLEDAFYAYAAASPPLMAILGSRWYLLEAPQAPTLPYGVYGNVGQDPQMTQSGPPDLLKRFYQFSFVSLSQRQAIALADGFRAIVDGFKGTWGTLAIRGVLYAGEQYTFNESTREHQINQTYGIWYVEA